MYSKVFDVVSFFQQNPVYIFIHPYVLLDHHIFYSLIKNTRGILLGVQIMKFLTMKFSQSSSYFMPVGANIVLNNPFSKSINLCACINMRGQLSQPYEMTGKITKAGNRKKKLYKQRNDILYSYNACNTMAAIRNYTQ